MKVAIDASPLKSGHNLSHRVRGTGFYIKYLTELLVSNYPQHDFFLFSRGDKIPNEYKVVHYPYFEPFFLTLPYNKKRKTIVTVHDLTPLVFPDAFPKGIKGAIKWEIQKRALAKADAIIADSEASKNDILKFINIDSSKINVVYLAAGEEFKKLEISNGRREFLKNKYKLPEKFILYVGDATWNKNLPRLVKAAEDANVHLVMVGSALSSKDYDLKNPWNKDIKEIQDFANDNPSIILTGFVQTEELVELYNIAQIFIMPSIYEGFGLPILEAMQCGCPVITTKSGSIPEVAGSAAFYVDPYDTINISSGIKEVIGNNSLRKELSRKGFFQAKKFSWDSTVTSTVKIYEKNS